MPGSSKGKKKLGYPKYRPQTEKSVEKQKKAMSTSSYKPEIFLLERLVWVKYMGLWWPALLYNSYTELQQHLYDELDMVLKAQFAMAIMRQVQEKRHIKVARLLGRSILEVIEVEEDCYCEFYWQLPNVLPKATRFSYYDGQQDLFLDFHKALDQVEDIIRGVSEENFALVPNEDQSTWFDRAKKVIASNGTDDSTISGRSSIPTQPGSYSKLTGNKKSDQSSISSGKVVSPKPLTKPAYNDAPRSKHKKSDQPSRSSRKAVSPKPAYDDTPRSHRKKSEQSSISRKKMWSPKPPYVTPAPSSLPPPKSNAIDHAVQAAPSKSSTIATNDIGVWDAMVNSINSMTSSFDVVSNINDKNVPKNEVQGMFSKTLCTQTEVCTQTEDYESIPTLEVVGQRTPEQAPIPEPVLEEDPVLDLLPQFPPPTEQSITPNSATASTVTGKMDNREYAVSAKAITIRKDSDDTSKGSSKHSKKSNGSRASSKSSKKSNGSRKSQKSNGSRDSAQKVFNKWTKANRWATKKSDTPESSMENSDISLSSKVPILKKLKNANRELQNTDPSASSDVITPPRSRAPVVESREPPCPERNLSLPSSQKRSQPITILPGLEADDIVPGAQDILLGVVNSMASARGNDSISSPPKGGDSIETLSPEVPVQMIDQAIQTRNKSSLSIWQRLTSCRYDDLPV